MSNVKTYIKKPVSIEAIQFTGDNISEIMEFANPTVVKDEDKLYVCTLEGMMLISKGDFIIKGIRGEFYPCKPDIFNDSYLPLVNKESAYSIRGRRYN